jgi:ADP-heptose:LPS heptosyltransferase
MVHRLRKSFPLATIVLIGPAHLAAMFPELDNIRARPFIYKNDGGLIDKMTSWPPLHKMIHAESRHDEPGSVLLFDPDTRMSQLGILPLLPDDSTCYFPSRLWQAKSGVHANLSILTNNWLNIILSESETETPYLILHNEGHGYNAFCRKLKAHGSFVIMINFGVGNDFRKKISGDFEEKLLFKLAQEPGNIIILDSGRGKIETQRVQYLLKKAKEQGINTATLDEDQITTADIKLNNGLIIFKGSLDALGKMISAADCFIGYDSCGQHLAAATGSSAAIIFAGAPSRRFIEHWAPISDNIETIEADSRHAATVTGCEELIARIKHFISKL